MKVIYTYISECCNAGATKDPVMLDKKRKEDKNGANSSLGKWHCSACGRNTKVTRRKPIDN